MSSNITPFVATPVSTAPVRGEVHMKMATDFLAAFPIGTLVSLKDFDDYCVSAGLCDPIGALRDNSNPLYAAHLNKRQTIRMNINNGGSCELLGDGQQFQVAVHVVKTTYQVRPIKNQTETLAIALSGTIKSIMRTKVSTVERLCSAHDNNFFKDGIRKNRYDIIMKDVGKFQKRLNLEADYWAAEIEEALADASALVQLEQESQELTAETAALSAPSTDADDRTE